jgi:hypothetical protein
MVCARLSVVLNWSGLYSVVNLLWVSRRGKIKFVCATQRFIVTDPAKMQDTCVEAYVGTNNVWYFMSEGKHLVALGDYVTCTCRKDWDCSFLRLVVHRVWNLNEGTIIQRYQLMNAPRMPRIKCAICQEKTKWDNRGDAFSFCTQCLHAYHKTCLTNLQNNPPRCPLCNHEDFFPKGHGIIKMMVLMK